MEIRVLDTVALMAPLATSRARPKELLALARAPLYGPGGIFERLHPLFDGKVRGGFEVMQAAQQDGFDAVAAQQMWGLFNPTRPREASDLAVTRLVEWDAQGVARRCLERFAAALAPPAPKRLELALVPGDPAHRSFMAFNHGLSAFGGTPGHLLVALWPTRGNLARLEPALARAVVHNVRFALAPPADPPALVDLLVAEGLAAAFVAEAFPELPMPWHAPFRKPDDWDDALAEVAAIAGVPSYDDLRVNVYGSTAPVGSVRPPVSEPMDAETLAYAAEVVLATRDATEAPRVAAHLYGDEFVAFHGHATAGLPPWAGFEVAYRLVSDALARMGIGVREALGLPAGELLALPPR